MLGDIQVESNPTPTNRIKSDINTKPENITQKSSCIGIPHNLHPICTSLKWRYLKVANRKSYLFSEELSYDDWHISNYYSVWKNYYIHTLSCGEA